MNVNQQSWRQSFSSTQLDSSSTDPIKQGLSGRRKKEQMSEKHDNFLKPASTKSPKMEKNNVHQNKQSQPLKIGENRVIASIDRFLIKFNKIFSTPINQDKGLKVVQWMLWFLSQFYATKQLKKASNEISMARFILRFYGLPETLEAIQTGSWEDCRTTIGKITGQIMAVSMVGYYPFEHIAYVKWTNPELLPSSFQANRFSAYSCRCWLVYLLAEMAQSIYALRFLYRSKEKHLKEDPNQEQAQQELQSIERKINHTRLQLIRSGLFTLPCIHWSLPKWDTHPWLSESLVNTLMWLESLVSLYQVIQ